MLLLFGLRFPCVKIVGAGGVQNFSSEKQTLKKNTVRLYRGMRRLPLPCVDLVLRPLGWYLGNTRLDRVPLGGFHARAGSLPCREPPFLYFTLMWKTGTFRQPKR